MKGELIKLPLLPNLLAMLDAIPQSFDKIQVGIWLEDLITTSARRAQADVGYDDLTRKILQLIQDYVMFTNHTVDPGSLLVLLRDLIEEYGSMIVINHIPIEDITYKQHDALYLYFINKGVEDGTT